MEGYTIKEGTRPGAVEVYFSEKPEAGTLEALKGIKFRWNGNKKCWYGFASAADVAQVLGDGETVTADAEPEQIAKATPIKFYYNGIKTNGSRELIKCCYSCSHPGDSIRVYAHGYGAQLPVDLFQVENETDIYTDYFDTDRATIEPEHPLYKYALYACAQSEIKSSTKYINNYLEKQIKTGRLDLQNYYKNEKATHELKIAEWSKVENPGQPTNSDLLRIDAENERLENERREQEHQEELERRERYLKERNEGRDIIAEEAEKAPAQEGETSCIIEWSEHPAFTAYKQLLSARLGEIKTENEIIAADEPITFSIKAADNFLKRLDDLRPAEGGYYKTSFIITTPDGDSYKGRYDIGDRDGGLIQHIRSAGEWYLTHDGFGHVKQNPDETNDTIKFADFLQTLTA